ncbi:MAG: TetR/AcrR family transcriptional regulator [Planctomycetota bacterium]
MAARPREFDTDQVLDAAMDAFWKRGYEATSLADLMDATGLQKGSIYKAFGDKHQLFLQVLRRYLEGGFQTLTQLLDGSESPAAGIRQWLSQVGQMCDDSDDPRGCFAMNSVIELAPHDDQVCGTLHEHFQSVAGLVSRTVERGQEIGEFRRDRSAQELTEFMMLFVGGIVSMSKCPMSDLKTDSSVDLILSSISTPGS